jgi:poly-gamma-glutamate synthesis protein (capsule biosynthesis protein)
LHPYDFTLCFTGDMQLADNEITTNGLDASEDGIYGVISPEFIRMMQEADLTCINNEFTFTTRGTKTPGKLWHFRGNPSRVSVWNELGVDIAMLANNHIHDFGEISLIDTIDTLEGAGIKCIGAGKNLKEACTPIYFELDGKTIAYVAATRAEKNLKTPQATETTGGVLHCYDPALFIEMIKEADANADFVIANVHWGREKSTVLEDEQITTGKMYIEAGADIIVGTHAHRIQGIDYYNGKPIIYNLGNFWFDEYTLDTMMLNVRFYGDDESSGVEVTIVPGVQKDGKTLISVGQEKERILKLMRKLSANVNIDENGMVSEKK